MIIGVVKERKQKELRVAITPSSVSLLKGSGYTVYVEDNAGIHCGYSNEMYIDAGAIIKSQEEVWECDTILKVKEPQKEEYKFFKEGQTIIGFLHLAANASCVKELTDKKMTAIACENIIIDNKLALLKPVSEIAGRKALFEAIKISEKYNNTLLSGTSVAKAGHIVILGGGVVAQNASDMALGIGCKVTILELGEDVIKSLEVKYPNVSFDISNADNIKKYSSDCDVVISTVLVPGKQAPKLITKDILDNMKMGTIIVDVSADQGGVVDIDNNITSHSEPVLEFEGKYLYAVGNMPASVAKTATDSIQGIVELIASNKKDIIDTGLQIKDGMIVNEFLKDIL